MSFLSLLRCAPPCPALPCSALLCPALLCPALKITCYTFAPRTAYVFCELVEVCFALPCPALPCPALLYRYSAQSNVQTATACRVRYDLRRQSVLVKPCFLKSYSSHLVCAALRSFAQQLATNCCKHYRRCKASCALVCPYNDLLTST